MVNCLIYGLLVAASFKPVLPNTTLPACPKPIVLTWQMLFKVVMEERYSAKYKMKIELPKFDDSLWEINKKEVIVEGFIIPTGINTNKFALSQNPYSACFFCGRAGPETVMTIKFKGKAPQYKTDEFVSFKGIFELNDKNIEEFIYILNNAVEIKK